MGGKMFKTQFKDQFEFDKYLIYQKIRNQNKYLTVSERKQLETMLAKDYKPSIIEEKKEVIKPFLVTDINQLRKQCLPVTPEDDVKGIIEKLKEAHKAYGGLGISANQIGILKQVSYIELPVYKDKKLEWKEIILVNAKIIEKDKPIKVRNEGCLSFPNIYIDTKRYIFCTVNYLDKDLKPQISQFQDIEGITVQHETEHVNGQTMFSSRWVATN
jgi:peptide deformylase